MFKSYNTPKAEQSVIKWLGRKGQQFIGSSTPRERERHNTVEGLFTTFNNRCKPQFSETIKLLQFQKLKRQAKGNTEEWMGRLRLAVVEYNYRQLDRQL